MPLHSELRPSSASSSPSGPSPAKAVAAGDSWLHEVKFDGRAGPQGGLARRHRQRLLRSVRLRGVRRRTILELPIFNSLARWAHLPTPHNSLPASLFRQQLEGNIEWPRRMRIAAPHHGACMRTILIMRSETYEKAAAGRNSCRGVRIIVCASNGCYAEHRIQQAPGWGPGTCHRNSTPPSRSKMKGELPQERTNGQQFHAVERASWSA